MSTVTQENATSTETRYAVAGLRIVLVALAAACILNFWQANVRTDDYRLRYPFFDPWLWNFYLSFYWASVVAAIAMWNWHKWGMWTLAVVAVGMTFTEIYTMGFMLSTLRIPAGFALTWFAAQPVWKRFV